MMPPDSRLLALLLAMSVAAGAGAQVRPLNDTGQITCYNNNFSTGTVSTGTLDPEAPGFNRQDCTMGAAAADALGGMVKVGGSTVPGRDYSKIANDGSVLPASAALGPNPGDWACTRDNITGLIWEVKITSGLRSQSHDYSWYDTNAMVNGGNVGNLGTATTCGNTLINCNTTAYRNAINALSGAARLCGASDWRLPTGNELSGLVHAGLAGGAAAIDATWFPNTGSIVEWTGENYAPNAAFAWSVSFGPGVVGNSLKSGVNGVRLVRAGQ